MTGKLQTHMHTAKTASKIIKQWVTKAPPNNINLYFYAPDKCQIEALDSTWNFIYLPLQFLWASFLDERLLLSLSKAQTPLGVTWKEERSVGLHNFSWGEYSMCVRFAEYFMSFLNAGLLHRQDKLSYVHIYNKYFI